MTTFQQAAPAPKPAAKTQDSGGMLALPSAIKDAGATRDLMYTLRHFHLGDPTAQEKLESINDDYLPALLDTFRDASKLRYDYPLFLYSAEMAHNGENPQMANPLPRYLQETAESFAHGPDAARILKDNIPWMEREIRQVLRETEEPVNAKELLADTGKLLQEHLKLDDDNRARLESDLEKLREATTADGQILGYGRYTAIHLLNHTIRSKVIPRRAEFRTQLEEYVRGLKTLLAVEYDKSSEAIEPKMLRDAVGEGGSHFDPAALSNVMDHSHGSIAMSEETTQRVREALNVLETFEDDPILVRFVHLEQLADPWLDNTPDFEAFHDADPCTRATQIFDEQAAKYARLFAAVRIAQLEIDGIYDPVIHDPWFANFNWEGFSHDEMMLLPTVIALESANRVAGDGMRAFSRLLSSGRPVQILMRVQAHNNPGALPDEDPFKSYRTELGYFGISHRQALVTQSSPARFQHLLLKFRAALDSTRTSLHIITTGLRPHNNKKNLNPWLVAGAGLEGRVHPFFEVNPSAGDSAAERMDFSGNPQPDVDWPKHPFRYLDENGNLVDTELAFTFADYAILLERLRDHFRLVPPECDSEDLVPVNEYLSLELDNVPAKVPFVWAADAEGTLQRLVVTRTLMLACLDRRNFWRTLQEMAGIKNRYVIKAVEETKQQEKAATAAEIGRLQTEHASEVEKVRAETSGEVMGRLTDVLMGLDLTSAGAPPTAKAPVDTAEAPSTEAEAVPETAPEEEDEDEVSFDEPWIDSILCTSCNDCTNLNQLLFVYDENKQAYIGDAKAGTYAQLVEAAEICPAVCIHPGKPLNPDEPGLDELVKRAVAFN